MPAARLELLWFRDDGDTSMTYTIDYNLTNKDKSIKKTDSSSWYREYLKYFLSSKKKKNNSKDTEKFF